MPVYVDRPVPEYHDRIVEKEVFIDRPVPEYHERIVEKPVPVHASLYDGPVHAPYTSPYAAVERDGIYCHPSVRGL